MQSIIVILNYNDCSTTIKLVEQIRNYTYPSHIIVVDNMSSDNSFEELSRLTDNSENRKITVIQAPSNGGYAKGNNFGIRYGIREFDPDIIFVANPDVSVSEDTFKALAKAIKKVDKNRIGILAPIVNQGTNVWNLPGFLGIIESLFLIWFNIDKKLIKNKLIKSDKTIQRVGVVEGSFFCISRKAYDDINGLDENTFLYVEENILAKRLEKSGYYEAVLTNERYDHFHSVSINKRYKRSKAKAFDNVYKGITYYNEKYLNLGPVRNCIIKICYKIAYLERVIYDKYDSNYRI